MLRLLAKKRAQNTAEYAILIGVVIAALIGIQYYVKRGVQARFRDAGDDFVTNVTTGASGDWTKISSTGATKINQFEHGLMAGASGESIITGINTQDVQADNLTSTMASGGIVTRDVERTTEQAHNDYQRNGYQPVNQTVNSVAKW